MTLFYVGEQHNVFWAVIKKKKNTQWKRTIMHTEVLLCRQITAVLQVKIVVPVRGGPHQEAEPGGRQEVTHSHCHPPCSWTDRERTRENTKQKTRSATSYTEPNKLPTSINIIAFNSFFFFIYSLNTSLKYPPLPPLAPVIHIPIYPL